MRPRKECQLYKTLHPSPAESQKDNGAILFTQEVTTEELTYLPQVNLSQVIQIGGTTEHRQTAPELHRGVNILPLVLTRGAVSALDRQANLSLVKSPSRVQRACKFGITVGLARDASRIMLY